MEKVQEIVLTQMLVFGLTLPRETASIRRYLHNGGQVDLMGTVMRILLGININSRAPLERGDIISVGGYDAASTSFMMFSEGAVDLLAYLFGIGWGFHIFFSYETGHC